MSAAQSAIFAAAIMLLVTALYPLPVRFLLRRARKTAADGSPNKSGIGGLVLNIYLTQFIYLLVIWTLAFKSNSKQAVLLVLFLTAAKLVAAVKLSYLLRYGFWDFPQQYRDYNSFFMLHYIGVPLSLVLDLAMFVLAGSQRL